MLKDAFDGVLSDWEVQREKDNEEARILAVDSDKKIMAKLAGRKPFTCPDCGRYCDKLRIEKIVYRDYDVNYDTKEITLNGDVLESDEEIPRCPYCDSLNVEVPNFNEYKIIREEG